MPPLLDFEWPRRLDSSPAPIRRESPPPQSMMFTTPRTLLWIRVLFLMLFGAAHGVAQDFERPNAGKGPTVIHANIVALDVDEIDSAEQNFTANLFFNASWQDDRLVHEGPGNKVIPLNAAWAPDFQFTNQQKLFKTLREQLIVSPTGEVTYRQRVWGTFSQKLHLTEFPFDDHRFEALLVAVVADTTREDIKLVQSETFPSGLVPGFSLPDWDITGWEAVSTEYNPLGRSSGTPGFAFSFQAERYVGYYMIKLMLPLLLIVLMSWIVFWIDPKEMGTQISVSVTSMLTLIAYRFMVGSSLPTISYLTRMDLFILCSTLLVFTTLLEAVITGTLARRDKVSLARRIDQVSRVLYPTAMALVILLTLVF